MLEGSDLQFLAEGFQSTADAAGNVRQGGNLVHFEMGLVENPARSKAEGRTISEEKEMITIRAPGSRDVIERVVTARDRHDYAAKYAAFKAGIEEPSEGTPLKDWPQMGRALVEDLGFKRIKTVEHVAGIIDSNISVLGPGGYLLRQKARDWLERAKSDAPVERLRAENLDLRGKVDVLMKAVESLQLKVGATVAPVVEAPAPATVDVPVKRKRGRPAKATNPQA